MDEIETMLADCEQLEEKLTDWERGFVDSLRHTVDSGYTLTERQIEKLSNIWNRIAS